MTALIEWLNGIPLAGLMLVVALGFTLGRISWRGLSLGPAGGTILVALLLGRQGLTQAQISIGPGAFSIGDFGFALFIYSVGFEAGPRFFASLRGGQGWRYVLVGAVVNATALLVALGIGWAFDLGDALSAGLLSGALTSPPTYAAAAEVCTDATTLAISFALTYPIGLATVVLLVQFLPRLLGDDLRKDAAHAEVAETGVRGVSSHELTRAYEVRGADVIGRSLKELDLTHVTGCYITRLHRGDETFAVSADTVLEAEDHVLARGTLPEHQRLSALLGPEVYDEDLRQAVRDPRRVRLTSASAVGKSLRELDLPQRHHVLVLCVERHGIVLEADADLVLERGDVLQIAGQPYALHAAADDIGRYERSTSETDVAVFAGGIFLGLLLGQAQVRMFGANVTLGMAGGLLLTGVLLGRFRNTGLLHAHVPRAARQLVRDLGILLFVAERGIVAGGSPPGTMEGVLLPTLTGSVVVVVISVLVAALFARFVLRMRPVDAWGSIGGGMTSSSALAAVKRASDSSGPALSYAASFAVASLLATIAGHVIVQVMQ